MKEILYIQAGKASNFLGTHFWNTQEGYFTFGDEAEEPAISHDVSFREGITRKGDSTFCPRLLVFDRRANFGALSDELYASHTDGALLGGEPEGSPWDGDVVEVHQDKVEKSEYQTRLDEEANVATDAEEDEPFHPSNVRFWSDYNRVFYHPRSFQRLPDSADWEETTGDWNLSKELFAQHDTDTDLMEGAFRAFIEECDELQGIQLSFDCDEYGGFMDSFLVQFRDESPKVPSLVFLSLSRWDPSAVAVGEEDRTTTSVINDALCLRSLESLSTLNVPIQHAANWDQAWMFASGIQHDSLYHTSAILSTHVETATLPLRMKGSRWDMHALHGSLNYSGASHYAHLRGTYPVPCPLEPTLVYDVRMRDFSKSRGAGKNGTTVTYASVQTTRGFTSSQIKEYDDWFSQRTPVPHSVHGPAYPTPSSFPRFASPSAEAQSTDQAFSALTATSATAPLFSAYAKVLDDCVRTRADVVVRMGLEFDDLKELKDELWALCDGYAGDGWRSDDGDVGEDE